MDVVEAAGQPALVAIQGPAGQPGRPGPAIPRHDPVVQGEPERRQLLVVDRDGRQALEGVAEVVPEESRQPAGERWGIRGERRRVEPGDEAARDGERVRSRRRCLQDGHRVGREVGPAGIASWARSSRQIPGRSPNASTTSIGRAAAIGCREATGSDEGGCRRGGRTWGWVTAG